MSNTTNTKNRTTRNTLVSSVQKDLHRPSLVSRASVEHVETIGCCRASLGLTIATAYTEKRKAYECLDIEPKVAVCIVRGKVNT